MSRNSIHGPHRHFRLTPLPGAAGVGIEGVDVVSLSDEAFEDIETALHDRKRLTAPLRVVG